MKELLSVQGISKQYPGFRLENVSFFILFMFFMPPTDYCSPVFPFFHQPIMTISVTSGLHSASP